MGFKIPKKFRVGGQEVFVTIVDRLEDDKLGSTCLGTGITKIANTFKGDIQSRTSKENTFVHEMLHNILDTMGRNDLSADEVFVCSCSSFLYEALTTMEYEEEE